MDIWYIFKSANWFFCGSFTLVSPLKKLYTFADNIDPLLLCLQDNCQLILKMILLALIHAVTPYIGFRFFYFKINKAMGISIKFKGAN